ncbi:MAG: PBP1A family penicillin-binding protein [Candidatus Pacebacteria bacterium]|nr:PBP1A family penicillin-binding protein [Candidatus Paceibacterota bacterium]
MAVRKKYRVGSGNTENRSNGAKSNRSVLSALQENHKSKSYKKKRGIFSALHIGSRKKGFELEDIKKKKKKNKHKKFWGAFIKLSVVMLILGFLAMAAAFIYFSKDIPNPDKIADRSVAQSTQIYDRTGETLLYEIHGDEKRTLVDLDQISPYLVKASVATEDKKFYKHHGIDLKGIARSIYIDIIRHEKAQGASTITQQLIKNSVLTSEKAYTRKIKEIILALETEQKFSKDEIMEMYLNQIPYGSNLYGAEVASQTFFGKSAKDLDIAESAMLAAIPQATTYYFPYGSHPDALEKRRQYIIEEMRQDGYITDAEAKEASEVNIFSRLKPFVSSIKAPHFVMYIKDKLVEEYGEEMVEKGGLKVTTTLNYDMQLVAEDAVKKGVEYNTTHYKATNAALVATDPKTGQILSMVGSKDYFNLEAEGNVNVAISDRQPGSSFKPFVYATAFSKGYTPDTILFDVPTNFGPDGSGKDYEPKNYNLSYSGPVTIRSALARSLNVPAVKTLYLAGTNQSVQTAHDMGITTLNGSNYGLSLVLGSGEVKLLDMTGAYSVFANDGQKNAVTGIMKVEDSEGKVLKEFTSNPQQVLDTQVARNITSVLSDNVARTPTFGASSKLYFPGRPVAAKTGTTSDYKDAWTVGYTPSISVGVWAGNNSGAEMNSGGGVSAATPIWNDFLSRVLADKPVEQFTAPEKITTRKAVLNGASKTEVVVEIDKACGDKLASENTPAEQKEQRTYSEVHTILYYVNKDDPQGDYPKKPQDDPQFSRWESGVLAWAQQSMGEGVNQIAPTEVCELRSDENSPNVQIASPYENQIIKDGKIDVEAHVFAARGVKQVEFYLDNNLLKIDAESPYEGTFRINGDIDDGEHTLKVKAYDNIDSVTERDVTIIINSGSGDSGADSVYLKPITGDFPLTLASAVSVDESSVKRVEFYYQLDSIYDSDMNLVNKPGAVSKIAESRAVAPGTGNIYQVSWQEDKRYFISGKYKIYALLITDKNQQLRSNERYIEIK